MSHNDTQSNNSKADSTESKSPSESSPLPLDETGEHYGYALLNVHTGEFVKEHLLEGEELLPNRERLLEAYETVKEEVDAQPSHIRVVSVNLENELDAQAAGLAD